jgi:hypothetical protein
MPFGHLGEGASSIENSKTGHRVDPSKMKIVRIKRLLDSAAEHDRINGCEKLWRDKTKAKRFLKKLIVMLRSDSSAGVRWRIVEILRSIGSLTGNVIDILRKSLLDEDFYVRLHARNALVDLGLVKHVRLSIEELLAHDSEKVRIDAVSEVLCSHQISKNAQIKLARRLDGESIQAIRRMAARALCNVSDILQESRAILQRALNDEDLPIRVYAAIALQRNRVPSKLVIENLCNGLGIDDLRPIAWCSLYDEFSQRPQSFKRLIANLRGDAVGLSMHEVIARGRLPTIGMKVWNKGGKIVIPAHRDDHETKYPWEDVGVYHSWRSHQLECTTNSSLTSRQICIHGDWFHNIHLIGLCQLACFVESAWNPDHAPVEIEGKEVGYVVESGGTLVRLSGMRAFEFRRTNRIDFVYGPLKDPRMIQLLMFAGLCARPSPEHSQSNCIRAAAKAWGMFCRDVLAILDRFSLSDLAREQWYTTLGWRSIRYRSRHERPYHALHIHLHKLASVLAGEQGEELRISIRTVVNLAVNRIEEAVHNEFYDSLPARLRQVILTFLP